MSGGLANRVRLSDRCFGEMVFCLFLEGYWNG